MNKVIKKIDIVDNISKKTGYSKNFSKKIINDLIKILILELSYGNLIIKNIGSFKLIYKNQRLGRNPKTKENYIIPSRKAVKFILSKNIKLLLN